VNTMKQYKDAIVHAAQLFRHLKGQHALNSEAAIAELPLAAARSAAQMLSSRRRRLAGNEEEEAFDDAFLSALGEDEDPMGMGMGMDMMGGGGGGSSGVDFLSAFGMLGGGFGEDESEAEGGFGDDMDLEAFMENFDQCGIDVEELTGKALGAYLLYGGAFSNFDPQDQETYPGVDTIGEVLLAFKDDDEHDCGDSDMSQLLTASTDYLQCSGTNDFFTLTEVESGDLLAQMEEDCQPVMDMVTDMATGLLANSGDLADFDPDEDMFGEDSELGKLGKKCLKSLFGDNAIGNYVRYEWNNFDKILGCFSTLAEELPHCVLKSPVQEGESMSLPLSLDKKMACLLGASSDMFTETMCIGLYEELDDCLPQDYDVTTTDVIPASCEENDTLWGMDLSVMSQNKIPAFCSKIYEGDDTIDTEEFQARFDYYNKNREYGWTIELSTMVEGGKDEVEDESSADTKGKADEDSQVVIHIATSEVMEEPEVLYEENSADIASVQSLNWNDGEAAADEAETGNGDIAFLLGKVTGILVFAAGGLALLIKSRGFGAFSRASGSQTKYADLAFKVEVPDMA